MVRNVDDLDFHLPSHAQDMLDGLQRLRSQPKLADVTLLVGGRELPCHRGLLALSSPYFHAMFAGDFAESFSARVELWDVEAAVVGQLVDFVYTGRLTITQANVEALTRTAARLHFPAVQKVCGRYLQQQLDATNCLGICEFGEQQGLLGVVAKAWAFLRENFEAVAQEDEFLQLSPDRLATCLASDLLQVQPEQSRLEALLRWVRHDPQARAAHLPELLGLVRLDAVPRPCVQQLLATEPLILESEACQAALSQGHDGVSGEGGAEGGGGAQALHLHGDGQGTIQPQVQIVPVRVKRKEKGTGTQTGMAAATICPLGRGSSSYGCDFLSVLAVGLAGRAGPDEVTGQGVAGTGSRQVHLLLAQGLAPEDVSATKSGDKTVLRPGMRCKVALYRQAQRASPMAEPVGGLPRGGATL